MTCNWNRCKRCGKVSESEYCIKCKRKIADRKRFKKSLEFVERGFKHEKRNRC